MEKKEKKKENQSQNISTRTVWKCSSIEYVYYALVSVIHFFPF